MFPELENGDILTVIKSLLSKIFVGQEARDVEEGRLGTVEEGKESIAEDVL